MTTTATPSTQQRVSQVVYPVLHATTSSASRSGRKWYMRLIHAELLLVLMAALISAIDPVIPDAFAPWVHFLTAIVLVAALIVTSTNRARRFDAQWFDGRAVAESVKTASWRYMMHIEPYNGDDASAARRFLAELSNLRNERSLIRYDFAQLPSDAQQITPIMQSIRSLPWNERLEHYRNQRLDHQVKWYSEQSEKNRRAATYWFWASIGAQSIALLLAILRIILPWSVDLVGMFAAVAAATTASAQLGRHDELTKSYNLAAQELYGIRSLIISEHVSDEQVLIGLVKDAESAISREHTMWVAKRT